MIVFTTILHQEFPVVADRMCVISDKCLFYNLTYMMRRPKQVDPEGGAHAQSSQSSMG